MITFLRNLLLKDFQLKLFSLVLATLTWFALSSLQQGYGLAGSSAPDARQLTLFNVPVTVVWSSGDLRGLKVDPATVEVTVEAVPSVLQNLKISEIKVMVDLTGFQAGSDNRKNVEVSAPPGITFVRVIPKEVSVILPKKP